MIKRYFQQLLSKEFPDWFRLLNLCLVLPILLWPMVFFMTIFMFDAPDSGTRANYLLFLGINAYPVYLLILAYYNSLLFRKNKILASVLPGLMILFLLMAAGYFLYLMRLEQSMAARWATWINKNLHQHI